MAICRVYASRKQKWNMSTMKTTAWTLAPTCPHFPGWCTLLTLPFCVGRQHRESAMCMHLTGRMDISTICRSHITTSFFHLMWKTIHLRCYFIPTDTLTRRVMSRHFPESTGCWLLSWPTDRWPHTSDTTWKKQQNKCSDVCNISPLNRYIIQFK